MVWGGPLAVVLGGRLGRCGPESGNCGLEMTLECHVSLRICHVRQKPFKIKSHLLYMIWQSL